MIYPCKFSRFGYEFLDVVGFKKLHSGIDLNYGKNAWDDYGIDVVSIADSMVVYAKYTSGWGNMIVYYLPKYNVYVRNAHLRDINVIEGQILKEGQKIGTIGNTGASTGPHLHFDIIKKKLSYWTQYTFMMGKEAVMDYYLDPIPWIDKIIKEEKDMPPQLHNWEESKPAWEWAIKNVIFSKNSNPQNQITYARLAIILKRFFNIIKK